MVNAVTSDTTRGQATKQDKQPNPIEDVQHYLFAKYREALKSGDKSFANSCLLSAKLFSANNPNAVNEEQILARSDGNVGEAAEYFARIFKQLFGPDESSKIDVENEVVVAANQMKEETRLLLTELKIQSLKLKSTPDPLNPSNMRQAPPASSPRSRMSSEDRSVMSRDSVIKLDSHLISHKRSCFYQELFDNLPQETRRNLIDYSIDNCDNPFERCRLMMLGIILSNDCPKTYAPKLLATLIELSEPTNPDKGANIGDKRTSRANNMCQYARSMLVLDAIPLIFSLADSHELDVNTDELISMTFNYYAEFCLNTAASEFDLEELHESIRKTLTSVDSLKSSTSLEDHIEERINLALNLMFESCLHEFSTDPPTVKQLEKIRETVAGMTPGTFASLFQLLPDLKIDDEIPERILFASSKDDLSAPVVKVEPSTSPAPSKGRGRPKRAPAAQTSVIISPDDGLRRHQAITARKILFVFNSCVQFFFMQGSQYLKAMRYMLPIDARNPLAQAIKAELARSQRRSRHTNSDTASPAKKHRGENQEPAEDESAEMASYNYLSHSLSGGRLREAYRKRRADAREFMDKCQPWFDLITRLKEDSPFAQNIHKLWSRFSSGGGGSSSSTSESLPPTTSIRDMRWLRRIEADRLFAKESFADAVEILRGFVAGGERQAFIKKENNNDERVVTVPMSSIVPSPTVDAALLRFTTQLIYGHIQLKDNERALSTIADLLAKIKQTGLAVSTDDSLHEMTFDGLDEAAERSYSFPLFTIPSLVHYCVHALIDILQCYATHPTASSDLAIGHAIVLSQASWPRYSAAYGRCISWIRANKPKSTTPQSVSAATKFTYPDFFYFVQDPNILEDFMALLNDGYTLDIKSSSALVGGQPAAGTGATSGRSAGSSAAAAAASAAAPTRSGKAITTRGVNKSFKEELKVALVAQMKHSCAPVPFELIIEFIQSPLIPFLQAELASLKLQGG